MAVQFILGRAGVGKTRGCIAAIAAALREGGTCPLVLLVPEQATYQAEQAILSTPGIEGYSRLQILSFERLRFRLLGGSAGGAELSRAGKQMVLQRILTDCRGKLKILGGGAGAGLAGQLADQITELYHADLSPEQLRQTSEVLEKQETGSQTALKLTDLAVIFEAYQQYLETHQEFSDSDQFFAQARRRVAGCEFLKEARLWVDGFSGFTAQEENLLVELLKTASRSQIALCMDPAVLDRETQDLKTVDPFGAFAPTEETYVRLRQRVLDAKLTLEGPLLLTESRRYHKAAALRYLEENFFDELPKQAVPCGGAIVIAALPDVRGECLWISREILRLVREEGLRYRDIAVVVPEMAAYQHPLVWALERCGVPYFLDRPRPLRTHPAVELLDSGLRAVCFDFRLADMTAYLKTGLAGLSDEEADLLDNYCRACGAEGDDWLREKAWDFADKKDNRFDEEEIDRLRRRVIKPLRGFRESLRIGQEIEPKVFVRSVWEFLEALEIRQTLSKRAEGDPTDQRFGHRQLWERLAGVLNELAVIFTGTQRAAADYVRLMQTAFASIAIKLIPPTLDQVLVGEIERSRHPDIQVLFLPGTTQKQFPVPLAGDSLLGRDDRKALEPLELDFAESLEAQLLRRRYLSYIALTRAGRRICLTRPITDEKGSAVQPWNGLERLGGLFSDLRTIAPAAEPQGAEDLQTEREMVSYLCGVLGRDSQADEREKKMGAALLGRTRAQAGEEVRRALTYENAAVLEADLVRRIYSGPLNTSVSRLETFAACPYQHFASYVLRLERRRLVRLEPMDFGTFYHDVLDGLFKKMRRDRKDWRTISDKELDAIACTVIERAIRENPALQSYRRHSAHNAFILSGAAEQIRRLAGALQMMIGAGEFTPLATEVSFGKDGLPALVIISADGREIRLRGYIDRIDTAEVEGRPAGLVFDYKRSSRSFGWAKWRAGLNLQMPAYLLALQGQTVEGKRIEDVVGAFYIPIQSYPKTTVLSEVEKATKFAYKGRGFFNGEYAQTLDRGARQWSGFYNFYVDKEGLPYGSFAISGALRPKQFEEMAAATKEILCSLAERILAGTIEITPYRLSRVSPCSWCDYRLVCKFDWEINQYRMIPYLDKQAVLERLEGGQ